LNELKRHGDPLFLGKVKETWRPFENSYLESVPIQFHQNLKQQKQISINWSRDMRKNDENILVDIEAQLEIC
jgi:hypothetical protein